MVQNVTKIKLFSSVSFFFFFLPLPQIPNLSLSQFLNPSDMKSVALVCPCLDENKQKHCRRFFDWNCRSLFSSLIFSYSQPFPLLFLFSCLHFFFFSLSPFSSQKTSNFPSCLGDKYHKTWAEYFVKYLDAYKRYGIDIWGLTCQNEPG